MINALNTKSNTIDVNAALAFKANSTDVYTKTQTANALATKATHNRCYYSIDTKGKHNRYDNSLSAQSKRYRCLYKNSS